MLLTIWKSEPPPRKTTQITKCFCGKLNSKNSNIKQKIPLKRNFDYILYFIAVKMNLIYHKEGSQAMAMNE